MKDILTDIRYAARGLRYHHRFSLLVVLILAIGIAAKKTAPAESMRHE